MPNFDLKTAREAVQDIASQLTSARPEQVPFTLLLGAGFSVPVIPMAKTMVDSLPEWLRARKGAKEAADAFAKDFWERVKAAWTRELPLSAGLPDLAGAVPVSDFYQAAMIQGLKTPADRRAYLRQVVRDVGRRINPAHLFLASLLAAQDTQEWRARFPSCFARTVFTTNFDTLLQRALQLVGKLYYMTDRPETLDPPVDTEHEAIHLIYTHGSVHQYRLANTEEEIKRFAESQSQRLTPYFEQHGVLVIGYSGWMDSCMQALLRCREFDRNLYWCDIHHPDEAEKRLGKEVVELLQRHRQNAFYVQIDGGADEFMRALHIELGQGQAPSFVLDPIRPLIDQLEAVEISTARTPPLPPSSAGHLGASRTGGLGGSDTLDDVLRRTIERMVAAKDVFDSPNEAHAKAFVAKLLNDALGNALSGNLERARELWTTVVNLPEALPADRARALLNRGVAWGEFGEPDKEIADYDAVLSMADAPAEGRARAHLNRGIAWSKRGELEKEVADYEAVLEIPEALAADRAAALLNRGYVRGRRGDPDKAIADYDAVIAMPDAPDEYRARALLDRGVVRAEQGDPIMAIADFEAALAMPGATTADRARALLNRGVARRESGGTDMGIADYDAVLAMPDAPDESRAGAFLLRGIVWSKHGEPTKAIADFDAALALPGATAVDRARALLNRGVGWSDLGEPDKAIADFDAVLAMPSAFPADRARALLNRSVIWGDRGEPDKAVADCDAVLAIPEAPAEVRTRAFINRGVVRGHSGEQDKAIVDFDAVLAMPDAPAEERARALINRSVAWGKRGEPDKSTADLNAVIAMGDAPAELVAFARSHLEPDESPAVGDPTTQAAPPTQGQERRPRKGPARKKERGRPA